jgi:hypothetical protein
LALKGFQVGPFYRLYRILYIVDKSMFSASQEPWLLHKKVGFYAISSN